MEFFKGITPKNINDAVFTGSTIHISVKNRDELQRRLAANQEGPDAILPIAVIADSEAFGLSGQTLHPLGVGLLRFAQSIPGRDGVLIVDDKLRALYDQLKADDPLTSLLSHIGLEIGRDYLERQGVEITVNPNSIRAVSIEPLSAHPFELAGARSRSALGHWKSSLNVMALAASRN